MDCKGRWRSLGAFIAAVTVLWLFFMICILSNRQAQNSAPAISVKVNLNVFSLVANRRNHPAKFHSFSKRRVPNGPDPIHNRRAWNCRLPRILG